MSKRLKLKSLLIGLALLALVGLLSGNVGQESASAGQAGATVTLRITNTAAPLLGAPIYEISTIIFTKNFVTIAMHLIFPPAAINPGETRTFGPFSLSEAPNGLTISGRKGPPGPHKKPFSFTIFPLVSDIPYNVGDLRVIASIVTVTPPPPPLPAYCPCPAPDCPSEVDYATFHFPWGPYTYRLEWRDESPNRYGLAWYDETTAQAYGLKVVGGHSEHGVITFKLPSPPWSPSPKSHLVLVNHDSRPGMGGGIYYTNPALNPGGVKRAKVFERATLPKSWVICWEVDPITDWNDQIDVLTYPVGP